MSARWDPELALEGRLNALQVYRAREARWVAPIGHLEREVEVPAGWYWASHWHRTSRLRSPRPWTS